jgi:hypothetical protein
VDPLCHWFVLSVTRPSHARTRSPNHDTKKIFISKDSNGYSEYIAEYFTGTMVDHDDLHTGIVL